MIIKIKISSKVRNVVTFFALLWSELYIKCLLVRKFKSKLHKKYKHYHINYNSDKNCENA